MIPQGFDPQPAPKPAARSRPWRADWRALIGLFIIGWGLLLQAKLLRWEPAYRILAHWYFPCGMIAIGLYRFWAADSGLGRAIAGIITGLGVWWLISENYGIPFDITDWWPLALIIFGATIISRAWRNQETVSQPANTRVDTSSPPFGMAGAPTAASEGVDAGPVVDGGPISAFAFWSGVHRRVSAAVKRVNLAAVMGGIELDLRPAVTVGGEVVVDLFVLMGGVEITLPPDWTVSNDALAVMGGIEDRNTGSHNAKHRLVLRGFVMMGGVEIKT